MGFDPLSLAALALTGVSTVVAHKQAKDAAGAQKDAQKEQRAMQASQAAQERRQQVRQERVRRAQIQQAGVSSGTGGSSGELGAMSGLSSQLGSNLGFAAGQQMHAKRIGDFQQKAADHMGRAQTAQQIGGLGMSIFGAAQSGVFKGLTNTGNRAPVEERIIQRIN